MNRAVLFASVLLASVVLGAPSQDAPRVSRLVVHRSETRRPIAVDELGIVLMRAQDGQVIRRLTGGQHGQRNPIWSPDGRLVAYARGFENHLEVGVVSRDGKVQYLATRNEMVDEWPSWAPDSRRFVVERWDDQSSVEAELFIVRADGSRERNLTGSTADEACPDWSPTGERIAFVRSPGGSLFSVHPDGSGERQLTAGAASDYGPVWSPDGSHILFRRSSDASTSLENGELFMMTRDGRREARLTHNNAFEGPYGWSPDGRRIMFVASGFDPGTKHRLRVMNRDGSGVTTLVSSLEEPNPTWTRDGRWLLYERQREIPRDRTTSDLWSVRVDGTHHHRVDDGPKADHNADLFSQTQRCLDAY